MGFFRGVIAGVAVAAGAATWYMSKAGERFRNQYRVDRKLGVLGDEIEERTRDVRARANAQIAEVRGTPDPIPQGLDAAEAQAAEVAAELAADVETRAAKVRKQAKDTASDA